ncbi:MAG: hypothetical protein KAS04_04085 [Candidatus Aenigmarchaeota archaeon]|nr:hypothetical protein [Candidatus Aenigmarchaeota archaeon]
MKEPTERQMQIMEFISGFFKRNLCVPTYREIGSEFRIPWTNAILDHLRALEKKGWIQLEPNKGRCIRFTDKAREHFRLNFEDEQ